MKKTKYIITMIIAVLLLLLIPSISNAAISVTRDIYSNNGSMKFNFTGLTLDKTHEYEYGLTKTSIAPVEKWYQITQYTTSTITINVLTTDDKARAVINAVDTGYITIKDKTINKIILQPYEVNLKIPFLKVTNFSVLNNGKEFINDDIQIALRNKQTSNAYYQYEKITDQKVINKYREIKEKNGDVNELQTILKTIVPTSNWNTWSYWNGHASDGMNGFGHTQRKIQVPDTGLYYMWVYFSGENLKDMYGYILVDNLAPEIVLESISLPQTKTIELGKTLTFSPNFNPSNATNKMITWNSSDETVATVDNAGKITPKKVGSTIITITSQNGKKATCTLTVTQANTQNTNNSTNQIPTTNKNNTNNASQTNQNPNNNKSVNGTTNIKTVSNNTSTTNHATEDKTTAKGVLPQTGVGIGLVCSIMVVLGICMIMYMKTRKLKDIV